MRKCIAMLIALIFIAAAPGCGHHHQGPSEASQFKEDVHGDKN